MNNEKFALSEKKDKFQIVTNDESYFLDMKCSGPLRGIWNLEYSGIRDSNKVRWHGKHPNTQYPTRDHIRSTKPP